jgi:ABC-type nickel/cobalt efflux system permease component RcnA
MRQRTLRAVVLVFAVSTWGCWHDRGPNAVYVQHDHDNHDGDHHDDHDDHHDGDRH